MLSTVNIFNRIVFSSFLIATNVTAGPTQLLQEAVDKVTSQDGDIAGYSLAVHSPEDKYGIYFGWENTEDKTPITVNTTYRIASITKTYVASTILRLWEEGMVDLQTPISELIDPQFDEWLRADGYDTDKILLMHLLTHTSGVFDHPSNPKYIEMIMDNPETEWTRADQVKFGMDWGDPVGNPGELYSYSDTGYVLVGNVIERITGRSLPASVRQYVNFEKLGLKQTYWEKYEQQPATVNRAHQIFQGKDIYYWSPTVDIYGGGGLVATPADVTLFINKLLTGHVFENPETLSLMLNKEGLPEDSPYRIGIFAYDYDGKQAYGHEGFWGLMVVHDPVANKTIAGAVIRRSDLNKLKRIIKEVIVDKPQSDAD